MHIGDFSASLAEHWSPYMPWAMKEGVSLRFSTMSRENASKDPAGLAKPPCVPCVEI